MSEATHVFPVYNTATGGFDPPTTRELRRKLMRLMVVHTRCYGASLQSFRHVLETNVGRGDLAATERVGALLCHKPSTALSRYDQSARLAKRLEGLRLVTRCLSTERPAQPRPCQSVLRTSAPGGPSPAAADTREPTSGPSASTSTALQQPSSPDSKFWKHFSYTAAITIIYIFR